VKLPGGDEARVPRDKVVRYLLAREHPEGGEKARFFLARGFDPRRPERLSEALREVAATGTVAETLRSEHGIKYIVDGAVESPDGTQVRLRTVWIVEPHDLRPRLVTAYPR
jgi:hypothetical protein